MEAVRFLHRSPAAPPALLCPYFPTLPPLAQGQQSLQQLSFPVLPFPFSTGSFLSASHATFAFPPHSQTFARFLSLTATVLPGTIHSSLPWIPFLFLLEPGPIGFSSPHTIETTPLRATKAYLIVNPKRPPKALISSPGAPGVQCLYLSSMATFLLTDLTCFQ